MTSTILITGANRGLGSCLVDNFLSAGFRVFAGERKPSAELETLAARYGDQLTRLTLDVTQAESVSHAVRSVAAKVSVVDVLVNNAAILPALGRGTIESVDFESALQVYDVNALGPLRVTQAFLPLLKRSSRPLILNISSEAGSIGDCWRKDDIPYCMSKAALNMQTAILKNHLGEQGFQLLAVHPGWLRTDMGGPNATLDPKDSAAAIVKLIAGRTPNMPFYVDHLGNSLRC